MRLSKVSRKYMPCDCGGSPQRPHTVVIHSTEGSTAEGAAAYLKHRTDGSAHIVVDNNNSFKLQSARKTTCGAGGFNTNVYHIEQAGFASWSRDRWVRNILTVRRAAYDAARVCVKYNIPIRWLAPNEVGKRDGITSHLNVQLAGYPTTHTDPGKHYPRRTFMALVRRYAKRF